MNAIETHVTLAQIARAVLFTTLSAVCALTLVSSPSLAGPLDDLEPGVWHEIPNSKLQDVAHEWPDRSPGSVRGIIAAWGGGTLDTREHRLVVWGGGHGDYGGNEVYALRLDTANGDTGENPWVKLTEPEAYEALDDDCSNPDNLTDNGQRRSQHTYNRPAYIPALNAVCDTGGSIGYVYCPALRQTDCYDFDTGEWHLNVAPGNASGTGSFGAVHGVTGEWWLQGGQGSGLLGRFQPDTMTWTFGHYDNVPGSSPGRMTAAIDTTRNKFVALGGGRFWALDLDSFVEGESELSEHPVEPAGDSEIINAGAPGVAYDPVQDRIVAWRGGPDLYLLDLDTMTWSRVTLSGDPGPAADRGSFGRFRYSPHYNLFVVVSSVNANAWVIKLAADPATCIDGQSEACYSGAAETRGVGQCTDGTSVCADAEWGTCAGEVMPVEEACDGELDDDCDGSVDEGCDTPESDAGMSDDTDVETAADAAPNADTEPNADTDPGRRDAESEPDTPQDEEQTPSPSSSDDSGCSCSTVTAAPDWTVGAGAILLGLLVIGVRRR